ncbi:hypothetical protein A2U01_0092368, partial [Trifolium medium]|nr:hypothetical protein [Trifolium medium]
KIALFVKGSIGSGIMGTNLTFPIRAKDRGFRGFILRIAQFTQDYHG